MSKINKSDIYDKNLNFLLGSGASHGLLPTLALKLKVDGTEIAHTVETLATKYAGSPDILAHLFSWYVQEVISPAAQYDPDDVIFNTAEQDKAIENYQIFLSTVLKFLAKKKDKNRANIFTTNYDGMIAHTGEQLLRIGAYDFHLNDGGAGFVKRTLNARNFSRYYQDHGVFDRHAKSVPQINLIQLHGSVYWYKDEENIEISYDLKRASKRVNEVPCRESEAFKAILSDETKTDLGLAALNLTSEDPQANLSFQSSYETLPVVNPTKWKFHETVFEEHYYQMLRLLSYELEKPDSVFIAFGFSFADEHILNLVKRSLSNPSLQLFICCFSGETVSEMKGKFKGFDNVEFITVDGDLDFTSFNKEVFNVSSEGLAVE
ncbi:SIR2 family protein [Pseudophaeobacter flagellatus]|uniref:SIR2 family protein n=1 Tax=Pseudophaeobacter flagellatus TaxID=2899119 RepID=UPI001E49BC83|nr:SIR2 family protein [Pseudophaeobacter flagellatus]MCD9146195.1 SIR2 family protein [Pseudophaeobacter flagellatus]